MSQSGLAVLATIKAGKDEDFRKILENLRLHQPGQINIDFKKGKRTHFARFVILDDHDKGANRKRLLFAAIFDGSLRSYAEHLKEYISDMDGFWGYCEDYKGADSFYEFLKSHNNEANTFLRAFPKETVESIQEKLLLRDNLSKMFDVPASQIPQVMSNLPKNSYSATVYQQLGLGILNLLKVIPMKLWVLIKILGASIYYNFDYAYAFYAVALTTYLRKPLEPRYSEAPLRKGDICRVFGVVDGISDEVVSRRGYDSLEEFQERKMVQNQMNVVTVNDPKLVRRHKAIMSLIQLGSDLLEAGTRIPTIHFGRWIMVDNDKRLLFLSNYDGTWENYIGDFVDRANVPVDAFWGGSVGWRPAGCRDIDYFKEGIRCHQTPASYYFCAYPLATVTNITRAVKISEAHKYNVDESTAQEWLKLL